MVGRGDLSSQRSGDGQFGSGATRHYRAGFVKRKPLDFLRLLGGSAGGHYRRT